MDSKFCRITLFNCPLGISLLYLTDVGESRINLLSAALLQLGLPPHIPELNKQLRKWMAVLLLSEGELASSCFVSQVL